MVNGGVVDMKCLNTSQMFLLAIVAVLLCTAIGVQAQTPFNDPSKNIFDTFDTHCNGSDPSIVFCDGFEDGTFIVDEPTRGGPASDYWAKGVWHTPFPDQFGRNFAECVGATRDPNRANFGAAGTRCTATMDWVTTRSHGQDGAHWIIAQPGNPSQPRAVGTNNYYIRLYFKESGVTSTRCPGGTNCPAFVQHGSNGYKAVEVNHNRETGGIDGAVLGTLFATDNGLNGMFAFGMNCFPNVSTNQLVQNQGNNFNHKLHRDEWIYIEQHVSQSATNGTVELWANACGRDGTQCTGTPTLRTRYTGLNTVSNCGPGTTGQKVRAVWNNWWNTSVSGEIQFDEYVVRDGEVLDSPIGFFTGNPGGGDTVAPSAPTNLTVN